MAASACRRAESLAALGQHQHLQLRALATAAQLDMGSSEGAQGGRPGGTWLPAAAAAAAALAGLAAAAARTVVTAHGDAPPAPPAGSSTAPAASVAAAAPAPVAAKLQAWLANLGPGADVSRIAIDRSQAGPGAGLGVFAREAAQGPSNGAPWWAWLWPLGRGRGGGGSGSGGSGAVLASFPLASAITVRTACEDPQLGEQFTWMLDKQLLDERSAIMVYLLLERLKGERSRYAPWIRALPSSFDVPIAFSDAELAELRGTALYGAAAAVTKRMRDTWARLEAPLGAVARDLGLPRPTWADWAWAHCVFWSRGQSLPVPESGAASSALARHSSNGSSAVRIELLEGLVPGLDFCNHRHSPAPQCWWEVVAPEREPGGAPSSRAPATGSVSSGGGDGGGAVVRLQLHAGARVRQGEELYISYGDKSNEELLMLYGFALPDNPHEQLMLYCPIPPQAEWDDVMHARMELLHAYGLRPQFLLPHPDVLAGGGGAEAAKSAGKGAGAGGSEPAPPALVLPGAVLDALEVFVLNFQELAVRSRALQVSMAERRAARAAGAPLAAVSQHSPVLELASLRSRYTRMAAAELRSVLHSLGLRMATLTTFVRLLEIKVVNLEGAEGTGPLEADEQLLARLDPDAASAAASSAAAPPPAQAAAAAAAAGAGADADASAQAGAQRARRLRSAVVYRMGQKRLARVWLVRAKAELSNLMALMRDMQSRLEAVERAARA